MFARAWPNRRCLGRGIEVAEPLALADGILRKDDQSSLSEGLANELILGDLLRGIMVTADEQHRARTALARGGKIQVGRDVMPWPRLENDLLDRKAAACDGARGARVQRGV